MDTEIVCSNNYIKTDAPILTAIIWNKGLSGKQTPSHQKHYDEDQGIDDRIECTVARFAVVHAVRCWMKMNVKK